MFSSIFHVYFTELSFFQTEDEPYSSQTRDVFDQPTRDTNTEQAKLPDHKEVITEPTQIPKEIPTEPKEETTIPVEVIPKPQEKASELPSALPSIVDGDSPNIIAATLNNALSDQRDTREESPFSDLISKLILDRDRQSTDPSNEDDQEGNIDFLSGVTSTQSEEISVDSIEQKQESTEENPWLERPSKFEKSKFEKTDIFQDESSQIYVTLDSSSDDFYSKFRRADSTLGSPYSPEPSLEEVIDYTRVEPEQGTTKYGQDNMLSKLGDTWTEFLAPGNSTRNI